MNKAIFLLWGAMILFVIAGSILPVKASSNVSHMDKIIHFTAYASMALIPAFFAYNNSFIVKSAIALLIIGGLIEIAQYYVPGRGAEYLDMLANSCGVITGCMVGMFMKKFIFVGKVKEFKE